MRLTLITSLGLLFLIACSGGRPDAASKVQTVADEPHECDAQAAHPDDIMRFATGKADGEVVGVLALRACWEAAKQYPNEHRFHFQLGRAFAALRRNEEAAKEFEKAVSLGSTPAKYYRAETILESFWVSGSEAEYDQAVKLLEEAAKDSFAPAEQRYKELSFSSEGFQNPRIIEALYSGDMKTLNQARILVALYAQGMQEFLSVEWNPEGNDCPAYLVEPSINFDLDAAIVGDPRNTAERLLYDTTFSGAEWVGTLAADPTWKGDLTKWRDYYKSLGRRDAQFLAHEFGCESQVTKILYGGLIEFSKAKRPLIEYAEELKSRGGRDLFLVPVEQAQAGSQ
jgi:tetratricopeptide (TPR) repeat protein